MHPGSLRGLPPPCGGPGRTVTVLQRESGLWNLLPLQTYRHVKGGSEREKNMFRYSLISCRGQVISSKEIPREEDDVTPIGPRAALLMFSWRETNVRPPPSPFSGTFFPQMPAVALTPYGRGLGNLPIPSVQPDTFPPHARSLSSLVRPSGRPAPLVSECTGPTLTPNLQSSSPCIQTLAVIVAAANGHSPHV